METPQLDLNWILHNMTFLFLCLFNFLTWQMHSREKLHFPLMPQNLKREGTRILRQSWTPTQPNMVPNLQMWQKSGKITSEDSILNRMWVTDGCMNRAKWKIPIIYQWSAVHVSQEGLKGLGQVHDLKCHNSGFCSITIQ